MADDPRVHQLLEEICDSGRTPEEVCGAYPELLPEVSRRWLQMRIVEAELDALFPAAEVRRLAAAVEAAGARAEYREMVTDHGHDAFLAEQSELIGLLQLGETAI